MSDAKTAAIEFLRSLNMDPMDVDFDVCVNNFIREMEAGLAGADSSLEMIPTFLDADNEVPVDQKVIVADAGGTNFRVAVMHFDANKKPVIESLQKFSMPAIDEELSKQEFFAAMAGYFESVASASKHVGFCFSYPTDVLPSKDGRLIRFSKEIKAPEVVGELIGENLIGAMGAANLPRPEKVVVLNDTVATLLAGVEFENRSFDSYIGFILGTGTNCSYVEPNANILKRSDLDTSLSQIVNTESGGVEIDYHGQVDKEFDASTTNPGVHAFEKMISGAYLGPLAMMTIQKASQTGLLSGAVSDAMGAVDDLDTRQLNDFMHYPYGDNMLANACKKGTAADVQMVYWIADRLVERASKLSAINLSAAAIKSGKGKQPDKHICIVADGTTFYQMKSMRARTEFYLKQYLEDQRGVYTEIISVDNAPVIGAAIAGLTN